MHTRHVDDAPHAPHYRWICFYMVFIKLVDDRKTWITGVQNSKKNRLAVLHASELSSFDQTPPTWKIATSAYGKPFKRSVEFRLHCVVCLPSVETWMEVTYDLHVHCKLQKLLLLRDYWTNESDGVLAEMQIINYSFIILKHIKIN